MDWDLISWSFAVIRRKPALLLFPIFSGAIVVAGMWLFWLSIRQTHHVPIRDYLWLAPAILVMNFATIFLNSALAACAHAYFSGETPTLAYGLRRACGRLVPIFVWSLVSTTVGLTLAAIENRLSIAGKLTRWIFGFAWGMTTYLVIPVLIAEDRNAFGSLRRSAQLLGETWGEQLVAEIRFGWRGLFLFAPCFVLGAIGANGHAFLLPIAAVCFVAAFAILGAAKGIFEVALYRYAALNESPPGFFPEMLGILPPPNMGTRTLDI